MSKPEIETAEALAAATAGPGKPDSAAVVSEPPAFSVKMLALGGPALSLMIMGIVLLIGAPRWPILGLPVWPEAVAETRVTGLVAVACSLCIILGIIVFRLASGGLKRVEAKAGPGSVTIETGDPDK